MKHLKKIILVIILVLLIIFLAIFYVVNKNRNYEKDLIKEVQENYDIDNDIKQVNKYDHNYIIITEDKVIVLNSDYEKIKEEKITSIAKNTDNYTLIYKNNKLVYEKTILKDDKVVYEYYDAYTYEYIDNMILEE